MRALEIKLSQGAKPGLGGLLPGVKVTPEIAEVRGIPVGKDYISPSRHTEFHDVDGLLDWVELLAAETGLPVGIKSAVGDSTFWEHLVEQMATTDRGVDFVTIDGRRGRYLSRSPGVRRRGLTAVPQRIRPCLFVVRRSRAHRRRHVPRRRQTGFASPEVSHRSLPDRRATQNRWLARDLDVPTKADR